MTCIVGFIDKKNNNVVMGGDSASSNDSNILVRKDPKIFRNGSFVIGCTTSYRMIQLLRYSFEPPKIEGKDIHEYMCTDFIDAVRKCFEDGGFLQKEENGSEEGGNFLVAYEDRLFEIATDFQVAEYADGIASVGCGYQYALGALHALSGKDIASKDKVLKALEAAEHLAIGVRKPFIIINTQ